MQIGAAHEMLPPFEFLSSSRSQTVCALVLNAEYHQSHHPGY